MTSARRRGLAVSPDYFESSPKAVIFDSPVAWDVST